MNDANIAGNDTTNVSGSITNSEIKYRIEGNNEMLHVMYDIVICSLATCAPATFAICMITSIIAAINRMLIPNIL